MSDTVIIPESPQELEEMLGEPEKMAGVLASKATFDEFIRKYALVVMSKDGNGIKKQIDTQVAAALKEFGDRNQVKMRRLPNGDADKGARYNNRAPGASIDKDWPETREFLKAVTDYRFQRGLDAKLKDWSSQEGGGGGFLVPESFRAELLQLSLESAIVRPRARVVPMDAPMIKYPTIKDTNHSSNLYGGVVAYWEGEADSIGESQPTFGSLSMQARKLAAYTEVPNELISDSFTSIEALIGDMFPEAISYFEDDAFFMGTGAGQPKGFLDPSNGALLEVAAESSQDADTILWENIIKMYARMLPSSQGRAVWILNIETFPQLALMALNIGTGGSAVWLNNGVSGPPASILGRPVFFTEKASKLGDVGDISFVDLSYYLIGDRQTMTMAASPHVKFQNDMTVYRIIERVDGMPWLAAPLTPRRGTATLSPFVTLAAR